MEEEAQIQLSFGMIFSVIIIVITLIVAGYVIMSFMKTADCAKLGSFDKSFEEQIDKAYQSNGDTQKTLATLPLLPSKVDFICMGNPGQNAELNDEDRKEYFLNRNNGKNDNLYFFPVQGSCGSKYASFSLTHAYSDSFFCIPVKSGKVSLKIIKDETTNQLVRLSK